MSERKVVYKVKDLIYALQQENPEAFVFRGDSENILFPIDYIHAPDEIDLLEIANYMHTSLPTVIIE